MNHTIVTVSFDEKAGLYTARAAGSRQVASSDFGPFHAAKCLRAMLGLEGQSLYLSSSGPGTYQYTIRPD